MSNNPPDNDNDNDEIAKEINDPANYLSKSIQYKQTNTNPQRPAVPKSDREINHLYQLTHIDREKVKVLFREAYVRGWRMDQIPTYIFIRSKINATYRLCVSLKKMQYEDDRNWFYELARDQIAYMGRYRVTIDRLEQLDKEMWVIIMNPKIDPSVRINATKESHSINRTLNVLLRDLPFITNLSKLYDLSELDPDRKTIKKLQQSKDMYNNNVYDREKKRFDKSDFDDLNRSLVDNIIEKTKDNSIRENITKTVDADVVDEMQRQINTFGYDTDPRIKEMKEQQRKKIEDRYIEHNMVKMDAELSKVGSEDEAKLAKIKQEYKKSMAYLDELIPPEQRDAITRVRELSEK